jgi:phosphoribosylformylglycinamidine synthase
MVSRVYVEKKPGFDVKAKSLARELVNILGISHLSDLRLINRYDVEGIDEVLFRKCVTSVFSEPQTDIATTSMPLTPKDAHIFGVEYLPGQFDMRATSASECIQLISQGERPEVRSAKIYVLLGDLSSADIEAVKRYVINPVEAREASLQPRKTLRMNLARPETVETLHGFRELNNEQLASFMTKRGLAMDQADIEFFQSYFKEEGRDPTITEVKVIDTYWSDHCRHTTFGTQLHDVEIDDAVVKKAFARYLDIRHELDRDKKPVTLMDMATIGAKCLKTRGILKNLDESEEINACTVNVKVDVNGTDEDWLFLFKNETHNHPTEIEPFGGAATCIGGAIRDPLSGRSYVYQAMRVTGAGDPLTPIAETLPGKLPQRKLVTTAAQGYSSYGNQVGLATGQVTELYHPGYVAKRMEIGAVVGATPADHVRRETPAPGDVIVLLGGRTGRDGIGGATGSSKAHTAESLEECGAEVQKGNAPVERRLQRLFRRKDACQLIKRCNDFGAGGVSVAIGELADGLHIYLDNVPKKYEGLDGTELAISESQERMAVALAPNDVEKFLKISHEENLEATAVARVTAEPRLIMEWKGQTIVNVSRAFLASNGAPKHQSVHVEKQGTWKPQWPGATLGQQMASLVSDENVACNKGLSERFDSTIGAATVLMPFGGRWQLTPSQAMVAKLPVDGETTTVSGMAWGFNPYLTSANQYVGAYLAVVESVSRMVATGFDRHCLYLTFQEYFERLRQAPERWGKPVATLLGALDAQLDLGIASIGGKDSMSGSFEDLDVPPTLVSFATGLGNLDHIISPEFKRSGSELALITPTYRDDYTTPDVSSLLAVYDFVRSCMDDGKVLAASTPGYGCLAESLFKMAVGNRIGFSLDEKMRPDDLFTPLYGSFVLELAEHDLQPEHADLFKVTRLGMTTDAYAIGTKDEQIDLMPLQELWESSMEPVFPYRRKGATVSPLSFDATSQGIVRHAPAVKVAKPRVVIPVFPGTNCEFDSARAFERAGALVSTFVVNNLTPHAVAESAGQLAKEIRSSQILMIPGGFSGGDEPDGSAKFIAAFFRSPEVTEAVNILLHEHDGLILGICNGFQALVKLGLLPYGDIRPMDRGCPTLTFNTIGRHQSKIVRTRVASNLSPWLSECSVGDIHNMAISHGEGRFVASDEIIKHMTGTGQIATQYVDEKGTPSMDMSVNPNGSVLAIEGVTSPDGRVFGKMGHTERSTTGTFQNVPGNYHQPLFESGVRYFA